MEVQARRADTEDFEVEDIELLAMRQHRPSGAALPAAADRRARGRPQPLRERADDRGGVADRRSDPRPRHRPARVRARHLGAGRGRRTSRRTTTGSRRTSTARTLRIPPTATDAMSAGDPAMTSHTRPSTPPARASGWTTSPARCSTTRRSRGYIDELTITGLTSNPTIFDKAIGGGDAYDDQIAELGARPAGSDEELFFELAIDDLRRAADLFAEVHERTAHARRLRLARGLAASSPSTRPAARSPQAARPVRRGMERPNVFIKIPGTPEGLPAIAEAIHAGIPVNVTLLFSSAHHLAAADAWMTRASSAGSPTGLAAGRAVGRLALHEPLGREGQPGRPAELEEPARRSRSAAAPTAPTSSCSPRRGCSGS